MPPPLLRVERLTKTFAGLAALQDVSFELEQGGIYGLIGPNGAGKTTLLAVLAGALRATAGRVVFEERDVTGGPAFAVVRHGIVRTHQVPRPFRTLSVLDNVEVGISFGRGTGAGGSGAAGGTAGAQALAGNAAGAGAGGSGAANSAAGSQAMAGSAASGLDSAGTGGGTASPATGGTRDAGDADGATMRILERVGLAHHARAAAGTLSVGDQKRLELARAIAARPSLLLCDEVCSGLTVPETESVLRLLREIRQAGTTILYVEHDLKAIMAVCDRVIVMDHGQKLAEGTPAEVQRDPAVVEAYIGGEVGTAATAGTAGAGDKAGTTSTVGTAGTGEA